MAGRHRVGSRRRDATAPCSEQRAVTARAQTEAAAADLGGVCRAAGEERCLRPADIGSRDHVGSAGRFHGGHTWRATGLARAAHAVSIGQPAANGQAGVGTRRVRHSQSARSRWHGGRLQSAASAHGPPRGAEGAAVVGRSRSARGQPVQSRDSRGLTAVASEHRGGSRCGRRLRRRVSRDGVHRRHRSLVVRANSWAAQRRSRSRKCCSSRRGIGVRTPTGSHPSRHQAIESDPVPCSRGSIKRNR